MGYLSESEVERLFWVMFVLASMSAPSQGCQVVSGQLVDVILYLAEIVKFAKIDVIFFVRN